MAVLTAYTISTFLATYDTNSLSKQDDVTSKVFIISGFPQGNSNPWWDTASNNARSEASNSFFLWFGSDCKITTYFTSSKKEVGEILRDVTTSKESNRERENSCVHWKQSLKRAGLKYLGGMLSSLSRTMISTQLLFGYCQIFVKKTQLLMAVFSLYGDRLSGIPQPHTLFVPLNTFPAGKCADSKQR